MYGVVLYDKKGVLGVEVVPECTDVVVGFFEFDKTIFLKKEEGI